MLFQRILYPTDFSDVSKKAADYILKLKEAGAQEVVVLHVIEAAEAAIQGWRETATEECGRLAATFEEAGLSARATVELGNPADVVLRTAAAVDASIIVIGATGKGTIAELILGSVSDKVIRKSHRPVLVIKP